jgi:glutaredoxin-related protein
MKKELFISDKCIHCKKLMEREKENPKYTNDKDVEIINITDSMYSLKRFLAYRDSLEGYKEAKENGKVGVPSLVTEGEKVEFIGEY